MSSMTKNVINNHRGFIKGIAVVIITTIAASAGYVGAEFAGYPPLLFEGVAGGAVLGAFFYSTYTKVRNYSLLVDATSSDRVEFDPPRPAEVTAPPYETTKEEVFAIETAPDGGHSIKVWVKDGSGIERHPYYVTGIRFLDGRGDTESEN